MKKTITQSMAAALIATASLVVAGGSAAQADMPCQERSTHQAFSQWGDDAEYFLAQNGDFERGTSGWSLDNAWRVTDQAPWRVNGANDSRALKIQPGGSAQVRMCVTEIEDVMRFFYETSRRGGSWQITVAAQTTRGSGMSRVGMGTSSQGWAVSPKVNIPSVREGDGRVWITIEIANTGRSSIVIDDVMIDPWRAR